MQLNGFLKNHASSYSNNQIIAYVNMTDWLTVFSDWQAAPIHKGPVPMAASATGACEF